MGEQTTQPASPPRRRARRAAAAEPTTTTLEVTLPRGRTPPLDPKEERELLHRGVALFNGRRYWHAHEAWETLWRAAPDSERDFCQGLIQVAAGLLHLQRRNARGARNKLFEGLAKLRPYQPVHRGIVMNELVATCEQIEQDLGAGLLPYLIPPIIRFAELEHPREFDR
ncbi:MAG: DUF309 domain-containing protein [Chloroflexota bacterium]